MRSTPIVDEDEISPYPCQCCKRMFSQRSKLANHPCNPRDVWEPKVRRPDVKLTAEDVLAIREADANGVSRSQIEEQYGASQANINRIVNRKSWKNI